MPLLFKDDSHFVIISPQTLHLFNHFFAIGFCCQYIKLGHYLPTDFVFEFSTQNEAHEFLTLATSVSLFRAGDENISQERGDDLSLAQMIYPEMFVSDYCSLPIKGSSLHAIFNKATTIDEL